MKIKKILLATFFATLCVTSAFSQRYNSSFGLRFGYDSGFTFKHQYAPSNNMEILAAFSPNYFQLTGLYEYQQPVPDAPNLDWYLGIGAHIGGIYQKNYDNNRMLFGADLIAGIEYAFPQAPFCISLDWKPSFNFVNDYNDYWFYGFALSIRYTF